MSIPTWLAIATYNRFDGSYIQGDCDVTGNVIVRGTNSLWIDTNASVKLNNSGTVTTLSIAELATLDGITGGTIVSQLSPLQTKTANMTASGTTTTYQNTHTYDSQMNLSTGRIFDINGTGKIRLNSGTSFIELGTSLGILTVGTIYISATELSMLDGITSNVKTSIDDLNTKTQNITATNILTTFSTDITITNGTLTSNNITLKASKQIDFQTNANCFLNFGTTGFIRINGIDILNNELRFLPGLTASVETRLASCVQKLTPLTYNSTYNTSDFTSDIYLNGIGATQIRTIGSDANTIQFDDTYGFINFLNKIHMYSEFQLDYGGTTYNVGTSLAEIYNKIKSLTYNSVSDKTEISADIIANSQTITPTNFGYISGLTSSAQTQLTNLQTKTTAITYSSTTPIGTTFSSGITVSAGTSTFQASNFTGTMTFTTGFAINIGGTSRIVLNSANAYLSLGTSLGILTTGSIYINATEMSMLDGASYNLPTRVTNNSTDIDTLFTRTTNISYDTATLSTNISGIVNFPGTTKTTGVTWADGPIKLKTTYVAPVSGELGFSVTSSLSGGVLLATTNVVRSIVNITLGIGVWIITYNCFVVYGTGTTTTQLRIGLNTTSSTTTPSIAISTEANGAYTASKNYNMTQIVNVSATTTYYLSLYSLFSISSLAVDGGNSNTTELKAVRIA